MKSEEAVKLLSAFADRDKGRSIGAVVFKDGFAMATDGRVLIRQEIDDRESVSERAQSFPWNNAMRMIDEKNPGAWHKISKESFEKLSEKFNKKLLEERERDRNECRSRYKTLTCPCCNAEVYLDEHKDELVSEKDQADYTLECDVDFPVELQLEDAKLVNFGYIHMILRKFPDMEIAIDMNGKNVLCLRNANGDVLGLLMTLRVYGDHLSGNYDKLVLERVCK